MFVHYNLNFHEILSIYVGVELNIILYIQRSLIHAYYRRTRVCG